MQEELNTDLFFNFEHLPKNIIDNPHHIDEEEILKWYQTKHYEENVISSGPGSEEASLEILPISLSGEN